MEGDQRSDIPTCQHCGAKFKTREEVKDHHHGSKVRGLGCWFKHGFNPKLRWNDHPSCGQRDSEEEPWVCVLCYWPHQDLQKMKSHFIKCMEHFGNPLHADAVWNGHHRCPKRRGDPIAPDFLVILDQAPLFWRLQLVGLDHWNFVNDCTAIKVTDIVDDARDNYFDKAKESDDEESDDEYIGPEKLAFDVFDAAPRYLFYSYASPFNTALILRHPLFTAVFAFYTNIVQIRRLAIGNLADDHHAEAKDRTMTQLRDWVADNCADQDRLKLIGVVDSFRDLLILVVSIVMEYLSDDPHQEEDLAFAVEEFIGRSMKPKEKYAKRLSKWKTIFAEFVSRVAEIEGAEEDKTGDDEGNRRSSMEGHDAAEQGKEDANTRPKRKRTSEE